MKNSVREKGIELAFLLRHDKSYNFDEHGWREVDDLIDNHEYTQTLLDFIVSTDNKGRYEYNEDKTLIRARQGHSIDVDVELEKTTPPDVLYHGTATRFIESIQAKGLKKMSRNYVHLSKDKNTAANVGSRHGEPTVYAIDAKAMVNDGYEFFISRNGVWLTDNVPSKYLTRLQDFNTKVVLWLDDMRDPFSLCPNSEAMWIDTYSPIGYPREIVWVKGYEEFISYLDKFGVPDAVCFDHDLGTEKSGTDCAKYLTIMCMDKNVDIPSYAIQSSNPVGADQIRSVMDSCHKIYLLNQKENEK